MASGTPHALAQAVRGAGIETGVHYPSSLRMLPAYAYLEQTARELRADLIAKEVLSLPLGAHLDRFDVPKVIGVVRGFFSDLPHLVPQRAARREFNN